MKDEVLKNDSWKFDKEVTDVFDNMIRRSIPDLFSAREIMNDIVIEVFEKSTSIRALDVGASLGGVMDSITKDCAWDLIDESKPMYDELLAKAKDGDRVFLGAINETEGLRDEYDLVVCFLVSMFMSVEERIKMYDILSKKMNKNSILITVDKIIYTDQRMNEIIRESYFSHKRKVGYTDEQIISKEKSLRNSLIPISPSMLDEVLKDCGFKSNVVWMNRLFQMRVCRL